MRSLSYFVCFAFLILAPLCARAEFILDDFDDPAMVVSPEMEGELIVTESVGALNATRTLLIFGNQADPEATLDVNVTSTSELTGNFIALNPAPGAFGLGRFRFSYELSGSAVDFTEYGANDAILVDVTSIGGPTPPPLFCALAQDGDAFYETFFNLNSFTGPGTIVLPFAHFGPRGGGAGNADFKSVTEIFFNVFINGSINGVQEQGWSIRIDRVRVGNVPGPTAAYLCLIAGVFVMNRRWRVQLRSI